MATIVVNGVKREVQAPADTPLLYVLRNELELSGPQFGCGIAQCRLFRAARWQGDPLLHHTRFRRVRKRSDHAGRSAGEVGTEERPHAGRGGKNAAPRAGRMDRGADASLRILPERA